MKPLETKLDELLVKKAPFQIPEAGRAWLVSALPWLTLIGGVLMLFAAWGLYQAAMVVNQWAELANSLGAYSAYTAPVASYAPMLWLSLALLVVEAVLFFVAFGKLKEHKKMGWDILFWVNLLNVVQSVVQAIAYGNLGSLLFALLGSVVGLYLLFQVRSYYTGAAPAAAGAKTGVPVAPKPADTTPPADKTPENKV